MDSWAVRQRIAVAVGRAAKSLEQGKEGGLQHDSLYQVARRALERYFFAGESLPDDDSLACMHQVCCNHGVTPELVLGRSLPIPAGCPTDQELCHVIGLQKPLEEWTAREEEVCLHMSQHDPCRARASSLRSKKPRRVVRGVLKLPIST